MIRLCLGAALLAAAVPARAQVPPAPDYAVDASWLCRPGRADACAVPLDVTDVRADGSTAVRPVRTSSQPVDCFYVYPTVSADSGPISDANLDAAERYVASVQFAPFREVCRTFAPLYRQATLAALRTAMTGGAAADFAPADADVAAAFARYLKRDNQGRGVILIGHSQGARLLRTLIQTQVEGRPVVARVVASYLVGTNVLVPQGGKVGGDFKTTPLCGSATDTGCIVSYVSFRSDAPPPAAGRFGRAETAGMAVACTDPARLDGNGGLLAARFPTRAPGATAGDAMGGTQWAKGAVITTPFVALPGLLSSACIDSGGAQYLAVTTAADPADPRLDRIPGDTVVMGITLPAWGLHLIDVNVAMGNLVSLAGQQSRAWLARR